MGRITGPVCRLCRRDGLKLFLKGSRCDTPKCALERRSSPPGMVQKRRSKPTEYGLHLREKQKVKHYYGVLERQFRTYYKKASAIKGSTGENLLRMLEARLDNVVYRMGFAATRAEARQLVGHRGIKVNEQIVNIPSYQLKAGDKIAVRDRAKEQLRIKAALTVAAQVGFPEWVEVDGENMQGLLKNLPERDEILPDINENLVVELYSK